MTGQEARDEKCNCAPGIDGLIIHNSWAHQQEARDDEREALIAAARTSIADADRCVALHITPSTGTLHRRLREVTRALADAHAELAARKHPEPGITDAFRAYVDRLGVDANEEHDGDEWWSGYRQAQRDNILRATAALRVPAGEGKQG